MTPVVHMSIGDDVLTPLPPEYLKTFRFTSRLGGYYEIDVDLSEPWSKQVDGDVLTLEERLLTTQAELPEGAPPAAQQLRFKFGVVTPDNEIWSEELQAALNHYNPTLADTGMEINLTSLAWQVGELGRRGRSAGTCFYGKRSQVVQQLCDALGFTCLVEETDDSEMEITSEGTATNNRKPWPVGNQSYMQFIQSTLIPGSKSRASGRTDYACQMRPGNLLVFAPPFSATWGRQSVKQFTYLCGRSDHVLSFRPTFKSDQLGAWGRGGYLKRYYNPSTKRYETFLINHRMAENLFGLGPATHIAAREGERAVVMETAVNFQDLSDQARSVQQWMQLFKTVCEASIELVGSPHTIDIRGGDIIMVQVKLPSGKSHWSSGYWLVKEALHEIGGSYTVTCQLQRDFSSVGNFEYVGWLQTQDVLQQALETYQTMDDGSPDEYVA